MEEKRKWYEPVIIPAIAAFSFTFIVHIEYINILISHPSKDALDSIPTLKNLPYTMLLPFFSGVVFGWLFDRAKELNNASKFYKNNFESAIKELNEIKKERNSHLNNFFKHDPLEIFKNECNHTGVLGTLIQRGLTKNYYRIQEMDEDDYLDTIQEAIKVTEEFQGVNRNPIRWFLENHEAEVFLENLKQKDMKTKQRIFVIASTKKEQMEEDLINEDTMKSFWKMTGKVDTYWITEENLRRICRIEAGIKIYDFAIYDELLIKYDSEKGLLDYKIVDREKDLEGKIFKKLEKTYKIRGQKRKGVLFQKINSPFDEENNKQVAKTEE